MQIVKELTDKNYAQFIESTDAVVFIDFYSDTCPPCQTLLIYLPNLAEHFKECEFRFNNRGEDLYKLLLKIFRKEPLN